MHVNPDVELYIGYDVRRCMAHQYTKIGRIPIVYVGKLTPHTNLPCN